MDEFQDTNTPQYQLVRLLAADRAPPALAPPTPLPPLLSSSSSSPHSVHSVFVVGDPDQAIYGWRGSDVANMRRQFGRDFPGSGTYVLRDNYRSAPAILAAAAAVIRRNAEPERAPMRAMARPGALVDVRSRRAGPGREGAHPSSLTTDF